jgi:hypothetical protein
MAVTRFNASSITDGLKFRSLGTNLGFEATGGNISTFLDNGVLYRLHTFTSSGTFEIKRGTRDIDYLVIAGGGSGGRDTAPERPAGGGGAGGRLTGTEFEATVGVHTVTVGAGGASQGSLARGNNGVNSAFTLPSVTVIGGGGGGISTTAGGNGGSGGGAGATSNPNIPGTGTAGQGNNGGSASGPFATTNFRGGGGGGGAGASGGSAGQGFAGAGGAGVDVSTFFGQTAGTTLICGGGGGTRAADAAGQGAGGSGGGGAGNLNNNAGPGVDGKGGGGGGKIGTGGGSGKGGDGIVYIKYRA